jgi:D-alanine--poly(phosphoribitol) ligase subunit 2
MSSQTIDTATVKREIHGQIVEIARRLGRDARTLGNDEIIPESGVLDSAGIMELVMWYEERYGLTIEQTDLTLDQFGTIDAMAAYLQRL